MLRFCNSRNKIDKSPPPYIVIWTKLIRGWPSIVNGSWRFALQAWRKFLDQVRILTKSKILWNHGRILLCPRSGKELYSTFGVNMEMLRDSIWTEPCCNVRGLKRPDSIHWKESQIALWLWGRWNLEESDLCFRYRKSRWSGTRIRFDSFHPGAWLHCEGLESDQSPRDSETWE